MWYLIRGLCELRGDAGQEYYENSYAANSLVQLGLWADMARKRAVAMVSSLDNREGCVLDLTFQVIRFSNEVTATQAMAMLGVTTQLCNGWQKISNDLLTLIDRPPSAN